VISTIRSKAEAAETVSDLAAIQSELKACQYLMDEDLRLARLKHEGLIIHLSNQVSAKREQLAIWARENRAQFGDRQSLEFSQGSLVFHQGNRCVDLLEGWTWKTVLKKMRTLRRQFGKYIRKKEELDKQKILADTRDEVGKLKESELKRIGVRVWRDESFTVEIKTDHQPEPTHVTEQ
jgi:phage host-nuclease inhibitor protein Gam